MAKDLTVQEVLRAGGKIPGQVRQMVLPEEADRLALKVLGVLAEATNAPTRRRALEKARRMLSTR